MSPRGKETDRLKFMYIMQGGSVGLHHNTPQRPDGVVL